METSTATWPAGRIVSLIGLILYTATGVFPYAASGLVAPLWGIAVLYFGWGIGFFSTILLYRRRSAWALAMPVAALAFWWIAVSIGEAAFDWTA
ncbi:MAG TPA: hypothetical protein VFL72_07005 [Acidimicrobiia bacterium]|nr:hypothetical protein [Acidimicrobiia bacterium]